jgi:hypothetical protein
MYKITSFQTIESDKLSTFERELVDRIDFLNNDGQETEIQYRPVGYGCTMKYTALVIGRKEVI